MANHKSAKKRNRQNIVRNLRNKVKKSEVRTAVKKVRQFLVEKNKEKAKEALLMAQSLVAKLAKTNIIHNKTASRLTSRLSSQLAKL